MRIGILILLAGVSCADPTENLPDSGTPDSGLDAGTDAGPDAGLGDTGSNDGGDPQDLCPPGSQIRHFSLTPYSPLPGPGDLDFPTLPNNPLIVSAGTGQQQSLRLDVCDDGGALTLLGILYLGDTFEGARRYLRDDSLAAPREELMMTDVGWVLEHRIPGDRFVVEGLAEAVQGNLQMLAIRLVVDSGLVFQGHDDFIAVARGNVRPTSIDYTTIVIVVGGLSESDVFGNMKCRFGEDLLTTSFTMSTATFDVEACTFLGGGFTSGYRIHYLAIEDTSAELTAEERMRIELTSEADVEAVMNYVWNHHNACDSFHLALPHADYAASSAPAAGCGATVPNAPERDFDEPPGAPVFFRIRYHGGAWVDGEMTGCAHYLWCP